jgi:hypothetical protein
VASTARHLLYSHTGLRLAERGKKKRKGNVIAKRNLACSISVMSPKRYQGSLKASHLEALKNAQTMAFPLLIDGHRYDEKSNFNVSFSKQERLYGIKCCLL